MTDYDKRFRNYMREADQYDRDSGHYIVIGALALLAWCIGYTAYVVWVLGQ